jgi:hypothetical protein
LFRKLIGRPAYIFKFAIYLLFICFAVIFYFSNLLDNGQDRNLKNIYSVLLLIYGTYRLIRTWQDFQKELRDEEH